MTRRYKVWFMGVNDNGNQEWMLMARCKTTSLVFHAALTLAASIEKAWDVAIVPADHIPSKMPRAK